MDRPVENHEEHAINTHELEMFRAHAEAPHEMSPNENHVYYWMNKFEELSKDKAQIEALLFFLLGNSAKPQRNKKKKIERWGIEMDKTVFKLITSES